MSIAAKALPRTSTRPPLAPRDPSRLRAVPGSSPGEGLPATVADGLHVETASGPVTYANFDHAASTPALVRVKTAVDAALRTYASVHRGSGYPSRLTSAWYEQAREEVAAFVGAGEDDTVVFTRNTTDSMSLLANVLPRSTTVIVFESEHHSTLLPWGSRKTVRLPVPASVEAALESLDDALRQDRSAHRLVVVAGASNVTGETWPLDRLVRVARGHGARVAVDAAQLAPHRRVDVAATGVDYLALSGHKLYAPFGAGLLVGRRDWLDAGAPYLRGGGSTARVTPSGVTWVQGAARHEGGSPNVIGAIALAAACATIAGARTAVEAHEQALAEGLLAGLDAIPGVRTYSIFGPDHDRVAVATFTVTGVHSSLVSAALSAEYGIGVRDGRFCAHLLVDELLDDPWGQSPTTAVRASAGLATTPEHVGRLLTAVARLAEHGPGLEYVQGPEGWRPVGGAAAPNPPRPW